MQQPKTIQGLGIYRAYSIEFIIRLMTWYDGINHFKCNFLKYRKKRLVYTAMQVEGTKIFRTYFVCGKRSCNEMVIYVL